MNTGLFVRGRKRQGGRRGQNIGGGVPNLDQREHHFTNYIYTIEQWLQREGYY